MPNQPTVKRKPWHSKPVKQHQRSKDMRWFYNNRKWRNFSKSFKIRTMQAQQKENYKNNIPVFDFCLCVHCLNNNKFVKATVTDHIKTYEKEPKGFDLTNLCDQYFQALCSSCHNKKSGREAHP